MKKRVVALLLSMVLVPTVFSAYAKDTDPSAPAREPVAAAESSPTPAPTTAPKSVKTPAPKSAETPEAEPTETPEAELAEAPEEEPTEAPAQEPEEEPKEEPTEEPEEGPTEQTEEEPTETPEEEPTEQPAEETEEEPKTEPNKKQSIRIYAVFDGETLSLGDEVTLVAELEGYDNAQYELQWQMSADNTEWVDVPGATGTSYTMVLTEENYHAFWRVHLTITETASAE